MQQIYKSAISTSIRASRCSGFHLTNTSSPIWTRKGPAIRVAAYHKTPSLRSTPSSTSPAVQNSTQASPETKTRKDQNPAYEMTFTCKPCSNRSTHRVSKQAYHHGSVLITCPECKNRHLIADHLNIFGDKSLTIEDILREKGELFKKGTLSENGDLELWENGSTTERKTE